MVSRKANIIKDEKKPERILLLANANSIHTTKWANSLAERGYKVWLVYNKDHISKVHLIDNRVVQISLKYGGTMGYYLNALELRKICHEICPDVINAHYASGYGTLARVAGVHPLLCSVWGSDVYEFPQRNKLTRKIFIKNIEFADALASTSVCMAQRVKDVLKKDIDIKITPFGVNLSKFVPCKSKEKRDDKFRIGIIKNLEKEYGIDDLINAVSRVIIQNGDDCSDIELQIYGEGEQEQELRDLCSQLGISDHVKFGGRIPNACVPDVLAGLNVFCNTTKRFESFGVSIVEAMAMKIPVIVTDLEGPIEVVDYGNAGIVVPRGDIDALAEKIIELKNDREKCVNIGELERRRVMNCYDWEDNVSIMEDIYSELWKNKSNA